MESLRTLAKQARDDGRRSSRLRFWEEFQDRIDYRLTAFFYRPLTQADYDVGMKTGGYDGPKVPDSDSDLMFPNKELWCMRLIVRPRVEGAIRPLGPGPVQYDCFIARMSDPNADELILHARGFGNAFGVLRDEVLNLYKHVVVSAVLNADESAFSYPTQFVRATKTVAHVLFADDAELIRRVDEWAPHHPVFGFGTSGH